MSVDTRTPRTPDPSGWPPGDAARRSPSGFLDDEPRLSMVKVPCDPAQVIVNHASFRVQLGAGVRAARTARRRRVARSRQSAPVRTPRAPVVVERQVRPAGRRRDRPARRHVRRSMPRGVDRAPRIRRRRHPHGRPRHGDRPRYAAARRRTVTRQTTQPLLPGVRPDAPSACRRHRDARRLRRPAALRRRATGSRLRRRRYERRDVRARGLRRHAARRDAPGGTAPTPSGTRTTPGRRMNLGVVLLPLRVFLGFISIYAGMGKLCDPVYFDGGERGSMVKWLQLPAPLGTRRAAARLRPRAPGRRRTHRRLPPGHRRRPHRPAGCWQRVAAVVGALLSAALLITVSWKTVPAYDAPDIIYLAAWSPLIIAGAPVYSDRRPPRRRGLAHARPARRPVGPAPPRAAPRRRRRRRRRRPHPADRLAARRCRPLRRHGGRARARRGPDATTCPAPRSRRSPASARRSSVQARAATTQAAAVREPLRQPRPRSRRPPRTRPARPADDRRTPSQTQGTGQRRRSRRPRARRPPPASSGPHRPAAAPAARHRAAAPAAAAAPDGGWRQRRLRLRRRRRLGGSGGEPGVIRRPAGLSTPTRTRAATRRVRRPLRTERSPRTTCRSARVPGASTRLSRQAPWRPP